MVRELQERRLRVDSKGRISLPRDLCSGVSSFAVTVDDAGRIVLEPFAEVPARELWLHSNATALHQVEKGIAQATVGALKSRGDFSAYVTDDDEAVDSAPERSPPRERSKPGAGRTIGDVLPTIHARGGPRGAVGRRD